MTGDSVAVKVISKKSTGNVRQPPPCGQEGDRGFEADESSKVQTLSNSKLSTRMIRIFG